MLVASGAAQAQKPSPPPGPAYLVQGINNDGSYSPVTPSSKITSQPSIPGPNITFWGENADGSYSPLPQTQSGGGMAVDALNAASPQSTPRKNLHVGVFADPFDSDPLCGPGGSATSTHDCSGAFQTAANIQTSAAGGTPVYVPVHFEAGQYYWTNSVAFHDGQEVYGDGRGVTAINIDQHFNSSASGVLTYAAAGGSFGPVFHDFAVIFAQPSDQTSRSNFETLAAGCTSATGGTGCEYPPAFYLTGSPGGRSTIRDMLIERCWDGISNGATNTVVHLSRVDLGCLDVGLLISATQDVDDWDDINFWPYGIPTATNLYNDVYIDGNTFCGKLGRDDGMHVAGLHCQGARLQLTSGWTHGTFVDLKMDGDNSTLEVLGGGYPGTQIVGMYSSGAAIGANTNSQLQMSAGIVRLTNFYFETKTSLPAISITGGALQATNGAVFSNVASVTAVSVAGSTASADISGTFFDTAHATGGAWTVPLVSYGTSAIGDFRANNFAPTPGDVGALSIATDNAYNHVSDNNFNGWSVVLPSFSGGTPAGYYDLGDVPLSLTVTPAFVTEGDFSPTVTSLSGYWFLRGAFADYHFNIQWNTNAYTTAAGNFEFNTNMPPPVQNQAGCTMAVITKITTPGTPLCSIIAGSSIAALQFASPVSGGAQTAWSTTQVPASTNGFGVREDGRLRVR